MAEDVKKKANPFNIIGDLGKKEEKKYIEEIENEERKKKFGDKITDKIDDISEKRHLRKEMKSKEDFEAIKREANADTSTNYVYMLVSPLIGFTVSPALYLLVLDINDDQLEVIKLALIGNAIGLILTVGLLLVAFRDGIRKSIMSVYRHFFTKKELSDLEKKNISEKNTSLKAEVVQLKLDNKQLTEDLYEYNIEKEIKKREKEKTTI